MTVKTIAAVVACTCFATRVSAADIPAHRLDTKAYNAFVVNWTPDDKPLCAALQSEAQWSKVVHPAPVMFSKNIIGPEAAFWADHAVLLISQVVAGGGRDPFTSYRVQTSGAGLDVDYTRSPPPAASYTIKSWLALAVPKPLAGKIQFIENGALVCSLDLNSGAWVRPDVVKQMSKVAP